MIQPDLNFTYFGYGFLVSKHTKFPLVVDAFFPILCYLMISLLDDMMLQTVLSTYDSIPLVFLSTFCGLYQLPEIYPLFQQK